MELIPVAQTVFLVVGIITLFLLAIKELYDTADLIGLLNILPGHAEKKRLKEIEKIKTILELQRELLQQQEQQRVEHLLETIGFIDKRHLASIRQAVEFINAIAAKSVSSYQQQLKEFCTKFAVDQRKLPKDKVILYPNVRFYIDFVHACTNSIYGEKLAEIAQALIASVIKELKANPNEAFDFNKIAVPQGGNYFLGLQVAERLRKPLVVIINEPRITTDCLWIGEIEQGDRFIILNDIAVTGDKLGESAEIIREKGRSQVTHIFALVERLEWHARELLSEYSEPLFLHSMLQIDDCELEELMCGKQIAPSC